MDKTKFAEFVMENLDKGWSPDEYVEKFTTQQRTKTLTQWANEGGVRIDLISTAALVIQETQQGLDFSYRGKGGFLIQAIIAAISFLSNDPSLNTKRPLTDDEIKHYTQAIAKFVEDGLKIKKPINSILTPSFNSLSEWLSFYRSKKGLTRKRLSKILGVSTNLLQMMELNKRQHFNESSYEALESFFGVSVPLEFRKTKRRGIIKNNKEDIAKFWEEQ
jgi:carboxypeptidase C (cathepsin A)